MLLIDFCDSYKIVNNSMRMRFHENLTTTTTTKTIMQFALWKFRSTKNNGKQIFTKSILFYWKSTLSWNVNRKRKISSGNWKNNKKKKKKNSGKNTTIEMAFNWHEIGFIRLFDIWFHNAIVAFVKIQNVELTICVTAVPYPVPQTDQKGKLNINDNN